MLEKIITSSVLILLILMIRALFQRKISPVLQYALWIPVALRLLIPGTVGTSPISIMNTGLWNVGSTAFSAEYERQDRADKEQKYQEYIDRLNDSRMREQAQNMESAFAEEKKGEMSGFSVGIDEALQTDDISEDTYETFELKRQIPATPFGWIKAGAEGIWILGMIICSAVFAWKNLSFYRYLKATRVKLQEVKTGRKCLTVYAAGEKLSSPCLFGIVPSVYIPEKNRAYNQKELEFILEHELTHYRHKDHLIAFVRILCLIINWFNPLVWIAAGCSVRDGELACDTDCIRRLGEDKRTAYGEALLAMINPVNKREELLTHATMMASGKKFMKRRIENITNTKKNSILTIIVTMMLALLAAGCTFTGVEKEKAVESRTAETNPSAPVESSPIQEVSKVQETQPCKAIALVDGELSCKVFVTVSDPVNEKGRNVVLIPEDLYLPDGEGKYARLEDLCRSCTAEELKQFLSRDMDLNIGEFLVLSYEDMRKKIGEPGEIAAAIEKEDIAGGYFASMDRWAQVVEKLLKTEGISTARIVTDDFAGLDKSLYMEETACLLCFEWEKAVRELHEFLYDGQSYAPSDYVLAIDGAMKDKEELMSMKEQTENVVKNGRESAFFIWNLYSLYLGESPYMISLLSGESMDQETTDVWKNIKVFKSGKEIKVDEEKGKAVFFVTLNFTESGMTNFPETAEGTDAFVERYLYLTRHEDGWYVDGPLHNDLPTKGWWEGEEIKWEVLDFGFSDGIWERGQKSI